MLVPPSQTFASALTHVPFCLQQCWNSSSSQTNWVLHWFEKQAPQGCVTTGDRVNREEPGCKEYMHSEHVCWCVELTTADIRRMLDETYKEWHNELWHSQKGWQATVAAQNRASYQDYWPWAIPPCSLLSRCLLKCPGWAAVSGGLCGSAWTRLCSVHT